jgi:hypothetical protein
VTGLIAWAIENTIADGLGQGMDGFEHAQKIRNFIQALSPKNADREPAENEAELKYNLATPVPENWIPFIAVKKAPTQTTSRDIQLQRAAMPRVVPGFETGRIRPVTTLLREGDFTAPYYVYEEEVPRSGAVVELSWNRTRWHDGRIVVWLGRKNTNGRASNRVV